MVDDALLYARPDGGLRALAIGGVSQRLFVQCPFVQRSLTQCLFRDGERIFGCGVTVSLSRVRLVGFLLGFLSGEHANGIFQRVGCARRDVYGTRDRLCRTYRRARRS